MSDEPETAPSDADLRGLTLVLGTEPPASLGTLDQHVVDDLAELVAAARHEQQLSLARAVDDALRMVPRPLRGVVKRVLLP